MLIKLFKLFFPLAISFLPLFAWLALPDNRFQVTSHAALSANPSTLALHKKRFKMSIYVLISCLLWHEMTTKYDNKKIHWQSLWSSAFSFHQPHWTFQSFALVSPSSSGTFTSSCVVGIVRTKSTGVLLASISLKRSMPRLFTGTYGNQRSDWSDSDRTLRHLDDCIMKRNYWNYSSCLKMLTMIWLSVYYPHGMCLEFLGGDETLTSFVSLVHAGVSGIIMPKGVEIAPIPDSTWTGSRSKKQLNANSKCWKISSNASNQGHLRHLPLTL